MILTSEEDWKSWAGTYTSLPFVQQFPLQSHRMHSWEQVWQDASDCSFVLESGKHGKYSFLGLHPVSTISGKGQTAVVEHRNQIRAQSDEPSTRQPAEHVAGQSRKQPSRRETVYGAPLSLVKQWMKPFRSPKVPQAPKFIGGCVGYWGYDVVRSIERLPSIAEDDTPCPDYYFMMINELWIMDHEAERLYCAVHQPVSSEMTEVELTALYQSAAQRAKQMKLHWDRLVRQAEHVAAEQKQHFLAAIEKDQLAIDLEELQGLEASLSKEEYMNAVERIQEYIRQGDVFQVNLSVRLSRKLKSSSENIYEWLRYINPSPYMGLLRFPDFKLISASPELLIKLEDGKVSTRPIAGTRRRGINEQEDKHMAEELILDEKERAEHIMLLDLERNDIGRIAQYGSVHVSELMVIEQYSHVMHIVSEVEGQLAEGKDVYDVIAATFPGGTITGAPKIRTMEIIEELEPVRRGPYTGSIGWIDYSGNMEFNITIRTIVEKGQVGMIQAGAGIVIDSDPAREYKESLNKAKALWKAIQYSEGFKQNILIKGEEG